MPDEILNPNPFSRSFRRDFEQSCRCYFGGGGGSKKPPAMPAYTPPAPPPMPAPPPPPPPPPPAPTFDTTDSVNDAGTAEREDAARRKGMRKTVMAGETGGYKNPVTGNSLLG